MPSAPDAAPEPAALTPAAPAHTWPAIALTAFALACAAGCLVGVLGGWLQASTLQGWVARSGALAWASYLVGNVVLCVLWVPRMWRLMAGGLLFGPLVGGALSVAADMLGGLICYLLARGAGRAVVARWLAARPRAQRLVHLLAVRRGTGTMALVRVCPLFHYTLGSYAAGLAGVRPLAFNLGSLLGVLPGAVLYPLAGDAMLEPTSPLFLGSVGAIALFLAITLWIGRKSLDRAEPGEPG